MKWYMLFALTLLLALSATASTAGEPAPGDDWQPSFGSIAIQHDARTIPLDTYARRLAADLTGRASWSAKRGPEAFAGREPVELLADLLFRPEVLWEQQLIAIDRRPMKEKAGLEVERRFFSPAELMRNTGMHQLCDGFEQRRSQDPKARPSKNEKAALAARSAAFIVAEFRMGKKLPIVTQPGDASFLSVSLIEADTDPGTQAAHAALVALSEAYIAGGSIAPRVAELRSAVTAAAPYEPTLSKRLGLEVFSSNHKPWRMAAIASIAALLVLGLRWLVGFRKLLAVLAGLLIAWSLAEQCLGMWLRIVILERAPVSNTYEALLWMGFVAIVVGLIAQAFNRKSWYLAGGLAAAALSMLFANLVPLESQTNALPAVLRSNYWLIIHVLTIVASYGALLLAAVLGHAYLLHDVLLGRGQRRPAGQSAHLVIQTYRVIQLGLILLTAGTILGGVWAAESWGRFWGWDPKETWSLISIVVYFAMLHARYVGWLKDFGLAVASIIGFMVIVWTFYGVNYVMAAGLHSYGFGSGGEIWIGVWAIVEFVFLAICFVRMKALPPSDPDKGPTSGEPSTQSAALGTN